MDDVRQYARHSFFGIMLVMLILLLIVDSAFYFGMTVLFSKIAITGKAADSVPQIVGLAERVALLQKNLRFYFVPGSAAAFILFGCLLWLYLRISFVKYLKTAVPEASDTGATAEEAARAEKQNQDNEQRLFLHLLSVLQREGRLLDFFSENLDHYEDHQIGAAVRSIHENSRKTLDKYITLGAVIEADEGDEVTVAPGFDPGAIKLTGNVTGEPPFKGVLRHRGWQAKKLTLPTLTQGLDARHIAPAEVEIP